VKLFEAVNRLFWSETHSERGRPSGPLTCTRAWAAPRGA
jgi:hypothetical protein